MLKLDLLSSEARGSFAARRDTLRFQAVPQSPVAPAAALPEILSCSWALEGFPRLRRFRR